MPTALNSKKTEELVANALLGANLDEIRFSNSYVLMRFINSKLVDGYNIYVDIEFYGLSDISGRYEPSIDFGINRSLFLGSIYQLIGAEVVGVRLDEFCELHLEIDSSLVKLRPTDELLGPDDFVWELRIEYPDCECDGNYKSISCVLTETGVMYFAEQKPNGSSLGSVI